MFAVYTSWLSFYKDNMTWIVFISWLMFWISQYLVTCYDVKNVYLCLDYSIHESESQY